MKNNCPMSRVKYILHSSFFISNSLSSAYHNRALPVLAKSDSPRSALFFWWVRHDAFHRPARTFLWSQSPWFCKIKNDNENENLRWIGKMVFVFVIVFVEWLIAENVFKRELVDSAYTFELLHVEFVLVAQHSVLVFATSHVSLREVDDVVHRQCLHLII